MVDQDVFLFDDTIRENIRHARPDAADEEIEAACREANCDSFIRKMKKGYGNLLSGGERQRLSIAHAILKNSPMRKVSSAQSNDIRRPDSEGNVISCEGFSFEIFPKENRTQKINEFSAAVGFELL